MDAGRNSSMLKSTSDLKSKTSQDLKSFDTPIDEDEELGRFVSQIEQNTFSILSIKQKFNLMNKNRDHFKEEASTKLDSFIQSLQKIESTTSQVLEGYNSRLDQMEILAFRPSNFHPIKSIYVPDNYTITSVVYSDEYIFIGTDNSFILVFSTENLQPFCEIGQLDDQPIISIGSAFVGGIRYAVAYTQMRNIHIVNPNVQSEKITLTGRGFGTWPTNLSCRFTLAVLREKETRLYSKDFENFVTVPVSGDFAAGGLDLIVIAGDKIAYVVDLEGQPQIRTQIEFDFNITHLTVSRSFFVVAGEDNIAVCTFDGNTRQFKVKGPTRILISYELFFFRITDSTVFEVHDPTGQKPVSFIGSTDWSPHDGLNQPVAACISDAILVTARDIKCVLWS